MHHDLPGGSGMIRFGTRCFWYASVGVEHFGKEIFGNMIALGRLLALMHLDVSDDELAAVLPIRYRQENINAVHFGYHLKEEDLHRGMRSRKKHRSHFASEKPCLLYTSPSPRDLSTSRMPSSA